MLANLNSRDSDSQGTTKVMATSQSFGTRSHLSARGASLGHYSHSQRAGSDGINISGIRKPQLPLKPTITDNFLLNRRA